MSVVYFLMIIIPIITWVAVRRLGEKRNNDIWNSVKKELFNGQHYEEIRKRKAYEKEVKRYSKSIRDRWRISGYDVDDYLNKDEDDEV